MVLYTHLGRHIDNKVERFGTSHANRHTSSDIYARARGTFSPCRSSHKFSPDRPPSSVVFTHGLTMGDQSQYTCPSVHVTRRGTIYTLGLNFKRFPMGRKAPRALSEWRMCQKRSAARKSNFNDNSIFARLLFPSEELSATNREWGK